MKSEKPVRVRKPVVIPRGYKRGENGELVKIILNPTSEKAP